MALSGIPQHVERFLTEYIDSVVQLEALLLMSSAPQQEWSAEQLSTELRIENDWAETQLAALHTRGLLSSNEGPIRRYRFWPKSPELDSAVRGLDEAYKERRVAVINIIYSKPFDPVRSFADAFRLRKTKDSPEGGA